MAAASSDCFRFSTAAAASFGLRLCGAAATSDDYFYFVVDHWPETFEISGKTGWNTARRGAFEIYDQSLYPNSEKNENSQ